jgi:DNA-binding NarL/FixJ family response regulator
VTAPTVDAALSEIGDVDVIVLGFDLGAERDSLTDSVARLVDAGASVIVVSALDHVRLVRQGIGAGARGYLSKRERGETLLEALRTVARGEVFLTPALASVVASSVDDVPALSAQELRALRMYAVGVKVDTVARRMDVSPATVREYLERVKKKYRHVGRPARTRTELLHVASEDGLVALSAHHWDA